MPTITSDHRQLLTTYNNAITNFISDARACILDADLVAALQAPPPSPAKASRLTPEQKTQLINDYASGNISLSTLSIRYLVPKTTLHRWLRERDIPMRPRGGQYHRLVEPSDEPLVVLAYKKGLRYKEIGSALGADPSIVSKVLRKRGITPNRRRKSNLSLGAVSPPYNRAKLVTLGLLWASLQTEGKKSKTHDVVLRHKDKKVLDQVRFQLKTTVTVKPVKKKKTRNCDAPSSVTSSNTWCLRLRSARLERLLQGLDVWSLPHPRSFFQGVVTRLAKYQKRGDTNQVVVQGRETVVAALDRFLRGLIPELRADISSQGNRCKVTVHDMTLVQLFKALEDPTPERTPSEVSSSDRFLAGAFSF